MRISINNTQSLARGFRPIDVKECKDLIDHITKHKWSCGTFKDGHRNLTNFLRADCIGLDFDDGMTIEEAKEAFKEYAHIIAPTKSHRKDKKDKGIADRFRVVIPLTRPITCAKEYEATIRYFKELYPAMDGACKDASRYWEPSTSIYSHSWEGRKVVPVEPVKEVEQFVTPKIGTIGNLSPRTLQFIFNGAEDFNVALFEAALDFKSQGYSREDAFNALRLATRKELGNDGDLDSTDIKSINSAFDREVKHEKRGVDDCFDFESAGSIKESSDTLSWLVDGLLADGALGLVAGAPKSGKSTLTRQLSKTVAQGGTFLGRKVKQGKVLYLALEEQKSILAGQLKALGVKKEDPFYIHAGPIHAEDKWEALHNLAQSQRPALMVIDTMILFLGVGDINGYNEMAANMYKLQNIAREANCHILLIHHQNKSDFSGPGRIMGSSAIHGGVDVAMTFDQSKNRRFISSTQRGGQQFTNQELIFDPITQTYNLKIGSKL